MMWISEALRFCLIKDYRYLTMQLLSKGVAPVDVRHQVSPVDVLSNEGTAVDVAFK